MAFSAEDHVPRLTWIHAAAQGATSCLRDWLGLLAHWRMMFVIVQVRHVRLALLGLHIRDA